MWYEFVSSYVSACHSVNIYIYVYVHIKFTYVVR